EKFDEGEGDGECFAEADAAGGGGKVGDVFGDFFELLFAEALDVHEPPRRTLFDPGFEVLDGGDAAFTPEEGGGFWAEGGDFDQLEDAGGDLGKEVLELGDFAGAQIFLDAFGGGFADAWDVFEFAGLGEVFHGIGEFFEGAGDLAEGEDFEGVFFEEG